MSKNKDVKTLLGLRIAKLRKIHGFSQEKFAEQRNLSKIETGISFVKSSTIEKIAEVLGINPEDLFNFNEEYTEKELLDSIIKRVKFMKNDIDKLRTLNDFIDKMF